MQTSVFPPKSRTMCSCKELLLLIWIEYQLVYDHPFVAEYFIFAGLLSKSPFKYFLSITSIFPLGNVSNTCTVHLSGHWIYLLCITFFEERNQ